MGCLGYFGENLIITYTTTLFRKSPALAALVIKTVALIVAVHICGATLALENNEVDRVRGTVAVEVVLCSA